MQTPKDIDKDFLIILAPDKGLCGDLIGRLINNILDYSKEHPNAIYLTVGKKMETCVSRLNQEIAGAFKFGTSLPTFEKVFPILKIIDEYFLNRKVRSVTILYSKFINVFSQKQEFLTLLPIQIPQDKGLISNSITLFEPSAKALLPPLLSHYLETTVFQVLLEAYASEQGARMIAMKNATDNAIEITNELKLEYNKARQEKITNEILDIGSSTFSYIYE